jgi:hypothetical protein
MSAAYLDFLRRKVAVAPSLGFEIADSEISQVLKPHQRATVRWAIAGGRRAIFAAFGLGKSVIQIEIVRIIMARTGGFGLIVIPLGVRQEFMRDAAMLGVAIKFIRRMDECTDPSAVYLTNYETVRDGHIDPAFFIVASLDEAAVLRGFGGTKTFREFMRLFAGDDRNTGIKSEGVRYRFVATATPSPNEYIELLAYSAYLEVMEVGQAKTRFFKRNSEKADKLTIHPHKEKEFWLWVATWALFVTKPSDIDPAFSDDGYILPALDVRWHEIASDHKNAGEEKDGQLRMFRNAAIGVQDSAKEKRYSLKARVAKLMEIVGDGRIESGIHARVLPAQPRDVAAEAARSQQVQLPAQPGAVQDAREELESGESGTDTRAAAAAPGAQPGQNQSAQPRLVRGEQGQSCEADAKSKAGGLRTDAGAVRCNAHRTKRKLRNLHGSNGLAESGSLSQDGSGPRPVVQGLQLGARDVPRSAECAHARSGLSDQIVVWCDLNDEQRALERAFAGADIPASSLYGNLHIDERERLIAEWRARETSIFVSKPVMYGAGVNLQQCHTMIFAGIGFKAKDILQAIHRIHRFMQEQPCVVHLIYTEAERDIRRQLERKWKQHNEMVERMTEIIREFGMAHAASAAQLARSLGVVRVEASGDAYRCVNNDCVDECGSMPGNSVDLIVTSIPFANQYEYTPSFNDFGHTDDNAHFWRQMDFLTPQLLRVLQPGRVCAIHVKDRITPGGINGLGFQTVTPVSDECVAHFTRHGFAFLARKTIVTDVVRENNQTYRLGWTEQCKDGSRMGAGMPEYMLIFRKPPSDPTNGYADLPVTKEKTKYTRARWQFDAHGFTRSSGDRPLQPEELEGLEQAAIFKLFRKHSLENVYNFRHDVKIATAVDHSGWLPSTFMLLQPQSWHSDVWTDIARMRTMNTLQAQAGREHHICPLQFDIVDRCIEQYSMPGETVLDPFGGLMTVPYCAVKLGRRGIGIELNNRYFLDGAAYCAAAESEASMPTLFDTLPQQGEAA